MNHSVSLLCQLSLIPPSSKYVIFWLEFGSDPDLLCFSPLGPVNFKKLPGIFCQRLADSKLHLLLQVNA